MGIYNPLLICKLNFTYKPNCSEMVKLNLYLVRAHTALERRDSPAGVQAPLIIIESLEQLEESEIPRASCASIEIVKDKETHQHCM